MYSGRGDEAEARFAAGHCALLTSSSASYAALRARAASISAWRSCPTTTTSTTRRRTRSPAAGLWVLAGKPPVEYLGVARFFAFLAQPDVQAAWHQKTGELPLTYAAYELTRKQGFYARQSRPGVAVQPGAGQAADLGLARHPPGGSQIRGIIDEELEQVWSGKKSALDALNAAVPRGNVLLEELEKTGRAMSPRLLRWGMNLWPPFRGAGIRVRHIADDWSEARVELRHGLLNRNFIGTPYGGSLFSMTDPFYALMLIHRLGERYLVWDQAASIDFVAPGADRHRTISPAEETESRRSGTKRPEGRRSCRSSTSK